MSFDYEQAFKEEAYLVIADYCFFWIADKKYVGNYLTWGQYVHKSLLANNLKLVYQDIEEIAALSNPFFGLDEDEMETLVMEFFLKRKFVDTYEIIKGFRDLYGGYVCKL